MKRTIFNHPSKILLVIWYQLYNIIFQQNIGKQVFTSQYHALVSKTQ